MPLKVNRLKEIALGYLKQAQISLSKDDSFTPTIISFKEDRCRFEQIDVGTKEDRDYIVDRVIHHIK